MSFATLMITILFFLNIGLALLPGYPGANGTGTGVNGTSTKCSNLLICTVRVIFFKDYNVNWGAIFTPSYFLIVASLCTLIITVSSLLTITYSGGIGTNPINVSSGSQFNAVHTLTIIAIALFISFASVPNFSVMGFPSQLSDMLTMIFGFFVILSVWGIFKGE
jgi:hypothetical protein